MEIGITGGTGFIGSHLAGRLADQGHRLVLLARGYAQGNTERWQADEVRLVEASVTDAAAVSEAFAGCDVVVHLAGINFERGPQTYQAVHINGTRAVVDAATTGGVEKVVVCSFLRARPGCGSAYHESKWAAEELVRHADTGYTILKPGVTYGRGDHLVTHLARWLGTVPVFARVGFRSRRLRPLAIADLVDVIEAAACQDRLANQTVAVTGPDEVTLEEVVRRIAGVTDRRALVFPLPVRVHVLNAWFQERALNVPLVSRAQVRMLAEELTDPAPERVCDPVPPDLAPARGFTAERIRESLPDRRRLGRADLRV